MICGRWRSISVLPGNRGEDEGLLSSPDELGLDPVSAIHFDASDGKWKGIRFVIGFRASENNSAEYVVPRFKNVRSSSVVRARSSVMDPMNQRPSHRLAMLTSSPIRAASTRVSSRVVGTA